MNNKESELQRILKNVVDCCATDLGDGRMSLTKEDVLGPNRSENVVMTRCILVSQIVSAGYSMATAAMLLDRTVPAIRHMLKIAQNYRATSRAYRIADAEATLKCKDISADNGGL